MSSLKNSRNTVSMADESTFLVVGRNSLKDHGAVS